MLKEILSITGKSGLYKLVSKGKNMLVVESLTDGKRIPTYSKDKVVSLGDIAMFTVKEEVPLGQVLENLKIKENGQVCHIDSKADNDTLRNFMTEILPDYDRDRVYPSDIRKLISWYNLLISNNISDFKQDEKNNEKVEVEEKTEDKK